MRPTPPCPASTPMARNRNATGTLARPARRLSTTLSAMSRPSTARLSAVVAGSCILDQCSSSGLLLVGLPRDGRKALGDRAHVCRVYRVIMLRLSTAFGAHMRAVVCKQYGPPELLTVENLAPLKAPPG